ncbi:YggT family protein [Psychromicrobium xiongbiense]|uniref:YggT family protein n=1 Tax=Psychromicrobium xiongbiense TaxID=3051184 RepID=UPI0025554DBD|nr:YggT family protein [Psychromicrobium sp. YIM S02556]
MSIIFTLLYTVILLFYLTLLLRIIFDWIQQLARGWRPQGVALIAATGVYSVTDPPLKLLRRLVPPLNLGGISLDVGLIVIFIVTWILLTVTSGLAS